MILRLMPRFHPCSSLANKPFFFVRREEKYSWLARLPSHKGKWSGEPIKSRQGGVAIDRDCTLGFAASDP